MPIRIHLDRVLLERRMSLSELADRVGITVANLTILKTGKARAVRFTDAVGPVPRAGLPGRRPAALRARPLGRAG